jgi:O-antigen/teichoic acid export membrane protein
MNDIKIKTVNGLIWSGIERFLVQGIQFVLGVIMARILEPSDYGIIGMVTIFLVISQIFVERGFSDALIRQQKKTETDFSTVFFLMVLLVFSCIFVYFFYHLLLQNFIISQSLKTL